METIRDHERQHHCRVITAEQTPDGLARVECLPLLGARDLLVDVWNCRATIGEMVDDSDASSRVRLLAEELLTPAERREAAALKQRIIYGECAGAVNMSGQYRPQAVRSARALELLVDAVEQRVGAQAWLA